MFRHRITRYPLLRLLLQRDGREIRSHSTERISVPSKIGLRLVSLDASLRRVALYDCMPTRRFAITGRKGEELTNERRDERTSGALSILHFLRAALRQNWQCHSVRRRTSSSTSTTQPNRETMAIFCLGSLSLSSLQISE